MQNCLYWMLQLWFLLLLHCLQMSASIEVWGLSAGSNNSCHSCDCRASFSSKYLTTLRSLVEQTDWDRLVIIWTEWSSRDVELRAECSGIRCSQDSKTDVQGQTGEENHCLFYADYFYISKFYIIRNWTGSGCFSYLKMFHLSSKWPLQF